MQADRSWFLDRCIERCGNSYTSARAGLGSGMSFWRLRGVEESSTVYLHLINFSAAVEKMITTDFDSEHNVRKLVNREKEATISVSRNAPWY
ncbi:hypothetical protein OOU_Y34scaffold00902g3 [Pyricularia oryzae Y34]|uniref:Uncharacterized protein n=2 Tax=Pyricularia oryzae TaxID=318829 RepID=A0AA97NP18_PYRO3|nr:hypothetical protein OOU_Y34scaffold00902g3 [Pyricularia oryzae Y34]